MNGSSSSGLHKVGERHVNNGHHDKSSELTERNDSKVDNEPSDAAEAAAPQAKSNNGAAVVQNATVPHGLDSVTTTSSTSTSTSTIPQHPPLAHRSPKASAAASGGLYIQTDVRRETPTIFETPSMDTGRRVSSAQLPVRNPSLRSTLSAQSLSPGSASLASPHLATMSDLTPLPSPILSSEVGPGSWHKKPRARHSSSGSSRKASLEDGFPTARHAPEYTSATSPPKRKKGYVGLLHEQVEASRTNATAVESNAQEGKGHSRNRSISDFVPEQLQNARPHRHVTFGEGDGPSFEAQGYRMQREQYLATQRGLTVPPEEKSQRQLPSPPPSFSSVGESDEERPHLEDGTPTDYLDIYCGLKNKRRKFRQLRQLGQGTFSKVMLATRERIPAHPTPEIEEHLNPHKLVAVKIVEHGPAGGAHEQRIETSLKREVEMLKSISHPCLVHLKACEYQPTRALLALTYCPGGDLFELASQKRTALSPPMVQRIFSELVSATRYLHVNWIVHRDIKLENVLVNLPNRALESLKDQNPLTHPGPIVTLTDLGLSRRIPEPPESPLLQTRCGSEDYAAPEILLGQPYDGRQTDAWALGVLLYALMEGRLPFDAPPGKPERSRNTHRIARCDWIWCRFGDEDGDWDSSRGAEFEGARFCVEGLLKKVRMGRKPLEAIEATDWVRNGIQTPGGLKMREEDEEDGL